MKMGTMTEREIDALLDAQTVAHLACVQDGRPYVLPLNYAYDGGSVYVHALRGAKIDAMRAHPDEVCVQVDAIVHPTSWRSVVAWGHYEELAGEEAARALRLLVDHLQPPNPSGRPDPFAPPGLEEAVVMFRVRLADKSGRYAEPR